MFSVMFNEKGRGFLKGTVVVIIYLNFRFIEHR